MIDGLLLAWDRPIKCCSAYFFMKKRLAMILGGMIVLGCLAFCFFRPSPDYDVSRVEPRLRALREPYKKVGTAFYMDGGSVGISITDRDGKVEQFAIPVDLGSTHRYDAVYVGAMHAREPGAVLVADSEQTKRMLIHVLDAIPKRNQSDDTCLMSLRRSPADFTFYFIRKVTGVYP
jgi:hypothetical protein